MAFDPKKDRLWKEWEHPNGLRVSVRSYNGGEPTVQIGPRVFTKKDGTVGFARAGRLDHDEFGWLLSIAEEIVDVMEGR